MNFKTITYERYLKSIPIEGRHILGQQTEEQILVYQAFNPAIADFAIEHQYFGGNAYSYSRMSWIKPNFLWMMYRCGWAEKTNQERVLGIWIQKTDFDRILSQSTFSSFKPDIYEDYDTWKETLETHPVRLQWDPDHDIYGLKQNRKAIQLGIKSDLLKVFGKDMICNIIDVTDFVKQQKHYIYSKQLDKLCIPEEEIYIPTEENIQRQIGLIS
ncbi:MAG: DUF4291 domain-containing protein [Bacteroidota bacterium]